MWYIIIDVLGDMYDCVLPMLLLRTCICHYSITIVLCLISSYYGGFLLTCIK